VFWYLLQCFTPNHNFQTITSQGKADYTTVPFFIMYGYFSKCQNILHKQGKGMDFMKGGRDKLRCFQTFCLILMFCGPPKKEETATLWKLQVSRVHNSLKCHRNVTKQTNLLQVDNLITNKSVSNLKASRRILYTQCVKTYVLANVKNC
jgi:hypothetical protein